MDCANCEAILDELRRGELPARVEAEARSHLALCPRCRAVHMRQLRVDAESLAPAQRIKGADRLRSAIGLWRLLLPRRKAAAAVPATQAGPSGLIARVARAPQVAMGTVMLLVVLVGLWSLPQLTRRHASRYTASVEAERVHKPKVETEASPVIASVAAPPAELDARPERARDARTRAQRRTAALAAAKGTAAAERRSDLELAMQHYRAREYGLATPLFSRVLVNSNNSSVEQTNALLYLARAERALGHCDRAVNSYDTLVRVYPSRLEARAALREGMACYARIGDSARAQRLLDHAAATPELGSSARAIAAQRPAVAARKPAPTPAGLATRDN